MGKLYPQIMNYWKKQGAKGRRFIVWLKNAPKGIEDKVEEALAKSSCTSTDSKVTGKEVVFKPACKMSALELKKAVLEAIGQEVDMPVKTKMSLMFKF